MKETVFILLVVVLVELARAQLSLPEMPGPPYPDKFGNNRWGVKYDPRVHGRGRNQFSAPSTSGEWGGDAPQHSPRYRGGGSSESPQPPRTRNKWTAALRPLVSRTRLSKNKRNRRPSGLKSSSSFDPTSDSFYKNPYSSKSIDGYVKNYLNTYNKVSQTPPVSSSGLLNIQNFVRPARKFRQRNFGRGGNRRSHTNEESSSSSGSLSDIYVRAPDNNARYRTLNPQIDFFGPQISKKKSDFAKTLVNIYNDYKPSENAASSLGSGNSGVSSNSVAVAASDAYTNSVASRPSYPKPPRRSRPSFPGSSSSSGPTYVERPFYSSDSSKRPRGPPTSYRGPPKSSKYSTGPLSSIDLHDDTPSYSSSGPSSSPFGIEYSDSPVGITSSDISSGFGSSFGPGSYSSSSSGPVSVSGYTSGPPPSSLYSPSSDAFGLSDNGPYSSFSSPLSNPPPPPPPSPIGSPYTSPIVPLNIAPGQIAPLNFIPNSGMYLSPLLYTKVNSAYDKKHKKSKRNKKRLQHTPMNVLRGLLGRGDRRDRHRNHDDDSRDTYKPAFAINYPIALPAPDAPPQYTYNPIVNSLPPSPLDFDGYAPGPPPPPPPRPPFSPLAAGLSTLRDTLTGYRDRPYHYRPPPPPPPPPRYPNEDKDGPREPTKEGAPNPVAPVPGPITQHMQDWPRIFTAMGTSVDAVAGGIHAVRKEISKMTGQTVAKGILMGGSAVHEVTKGMAHMISKMSSI